MDSNLGRFRLKRVGWQYLKSKSVGSHSDLNCIQSVIHILCLFS